MKSILLPKFVFFRSRLRLSLKNTNLLFYCFICFLQGCCTSYYNIPVPLSLHDVILNRSPLFFWQKRRKRKANKRKTPLRRVSRLARRDQRSARWMCGRFLKKRRKTLRRHRRGGHSLLQGVFMPQGLNLGLLHCTHILCHLSHQESPEY